MSFLLHSERFREEVRKLVLLNTQEERDRAILLAYRLLQIINDPEIPDIYQFVADQLKVKLEVVQLACGNWEAASDPRERNARHADATAMRRYSQPGESTSMKIVLTVELDLAHLAELAEFKQRLLTELRTGAGMTDESALKNLIMRQSQIELTRSDQS